MIRKIILSIVLAITILCVGCNTAPTDCNVVDIFPGGVELESGDIIVARSGGFLAASMASLGKPSTPYGHSGVYFKDDGGCGRIIHMQPNGLVVVKLQDFWDSYYHVGVIRLKPRTNIDYDRFDEECSKLIEYNNKNPISAGSWGEQLNGDACSGEGKYQKYLYCITLVNLLYMKSKLPIPYKKCFDISDEPMIRLVYNNAEKVDLNILTIPSLFSNDKFEKVSEYSFSAKEELSGKVDDAMLHAVNKYLAKGYNVKNPPLHMRAVICGAYGLKEITMPILPAGVKNFLKRIDSVHKVNVLYTLNKYVKMVRKESLNILQDNPRSDIETVTLKVAKKYRDKGFAMSDVR